MSNQITVVGNVVRDPELKFTATGKAVTTFTVAQTPRKFNRETNEWVDASDTNYFRCTIWDSPAENVAETLQTGNRVIVTGTLSTRTYKDKEQVEHTTTNNLTVDEVGPSLRYSTAVVTKAQRNGGGGNNNGWNNGGGNANVSNSRPAVATQNNDEPPF